MAEADSIHPTPNACPPASSAAEAAAPAEITFAAAANLFAVGRAPHRSARAGWEPPAVADLRPALPQYEICALVGRGGMGAVYRGIQRTLDRDVAIKILPPEVAAEDAQFPERFKLEGKAMARLSHPGIVAVFDAGETAGGLLYFIMEYIEGTDLEAMVRTRGRLPAEEALAIVIRVCDALEFAHARGFVHRDIKPSNIMVDVGGEVKVADFGLARRTVGENERLTGRSMAIGTAEYSAPEAFLPEVTLDGRADIYSVGVMLYQMLTGQIPRGRFEAPSARVAGLDPRLDAIVDRAMQTDRERRYPTVRELRADLERTFTGVRPAAHRPEPARGHPRGLWIGAGVATLVALAGAGWFFRGGSSVPPWAKPAATFSPAEATRELPFVNSLGMCFVPVPITGGPSGGQRVLFSIWETRQQDYEKFAAETKREWSPPGFAREALHPAVEVSWDDAKGFCDWLTDRERRAGRIGAGESYRLPTDHEWSCAVGIGDREDPAQSPEQKDEEMLDDFPWGGAWPPPPGAGNYSGEEAVGYETWKAQSILPGYRDDFPETAPVGSFPANRFGLFDLGGNVWEWCEDRFQPAKPWRVMRGASFNNGGRGGVFSANRDPQAPEAHRENFGFRVVLAGAPASLQGAAARGWRAMAFNHREPLEGGLEGAP